MLTDMTMNFGNRTLVSGNMALSEMTFGWLTTVYWFFIVLLYRNQWNRIVLSHAVYHYANKTVITVIHSIVLGCCMSINVLMNFHLSTSLSIISLPLINNLEFKCRTRCCIIVKRVKVLVISMYIAKRWRSWHWHKDNSVSLQMLSQWVLILKNQKQFGLRLIWNPVQNPVNRLRCIVQSVLLVTYDIRRLESGCR